MKATASIIMHAPVEQVWVFVSDITHMDEWVAGVSDPRPTTPGKIGLGATFASEYTYGGKTSTVQYVVTDFDPPNRFAIKSTEGPFPFEGVMRLEPASRGTRAYNTIDARSDSLFTTLTFILLNPLVRVMMKRQLKKELKTLKRLMERRKPAA